MTSASDLKEVINIKSGFLIRITFMRIRIQLFTSIRIQIQILLLIKVMQICDHWTPDPPELHFEPPRLNFETPRLHFRSRKPLNFDLNARIWIQFFTPYTGNNADPWGSGSEALY